MRFSLYDNREFYQFIKNEFNKLELKIEPQSKFFIQNICTNNDTYDILLIAHYDSPPEMPTFLANLYKKYGLNNIANFTNILKWIGLIFLVFYITLLFFNTEIFELLFYYVIYKTIEFMPSFAPATILVIRVSFFLWFLYYFFLRPNKVNMNDNTSGVIAILAILNIIYEKDKRLLKNIKVVFTDGEEFGLLGAILLRLKLDCFLRYFLPRFRETKPLILNFDGVGVGSQLCLMPLEECNPLCKYLKKEHPNKYDIIINKVKASSDYDVFKGYNRISIHFLEKALKENQYYMPKAHTSNDVEINEEQLAGLTNDVAQFLIKYIKESRNL